jgi:hypothetical protein
MWQVHEMVGAYLAKLRSLPFILRHLSSIVIRHIGVEVAVIVIVRLPSVVAHLCRESAF